MSARELALRAVKVGDVIFAIAGGGQEKLMLVYEADDRSIFARHVTTGSKVRFGRNGKTTLVPGGGRCAIVSVAALPPGDYDTVIGLDRKMRTGEEYPDFVLSSAEIQLLLTCDKFFKAHPLPE